MTALDKYRKLEGPGLWAASQGEQRRDVIVSFGDATLVISDSRSMTVLSHWSLPAVERINPGKRPALFRPEGDSDEVLELDDDWLINALHVVQGALRPTGSWFSRSRKKIALGAGAVALLLASSMMPAALRDHTASVVPMAKRVELGNIVRADLASLGARHCTSPNGEAALASLQRALFQTPAQIVVMRGLPLEVARIQHVMGRYFLVDARLLEDAQSPEALAGAILMALQRSADEDPLLPLLRHAGVIATFRLLTSAEMPASAMRGYGAALLRIPLAVPKLDPLLERFARVNLSTRALVDHPVRLDPTLGVLAEALRNQDPLAGEPAETALLSDGQWVSLQNICDS
ncbi:MAG: hypothetical protein EA339_01885 [Rhodobacteraceae bacterium]|nr:MAG: hypothetical protein EA339_01885 [Paracoccaceae bacterium]